MLKWSVSILLLVSFAAWPLIFGPYNSALITFGSLGPWWLLAFTLIIFFVAWFPPLSGPIHRQLQRMANPSSRGQLLGAVAVTIFSIGYLYVTARMEHRQFFPYIHDEFSFLIQANQFARHRLWMPAHPMAPFFESFQLFTAPVYASIYFPGTAVVHLPGTWLHAQPFVTSLAVSGAVAGLLCWIVCKTIDAVAGGLAVALLLSDGLYRQESLLTLSHMPVLMFGLLSIVAWLRWRDTFGDDWAIAIGFFLAFAAITRPVDALCFAIPIGIAVLVRCRVKRSFTAVCWIAIGMLPLLLLQLLLNRGITNSWLRTPFGLYADNEYPGSSYGFHPPRTFSRPQSDLPQLQKLYRQEYWPLIEQHRPQNVFTDLMTHRLQFLLSQISPTPYPVLVLLLAVCLLGLTTLPADRRGPAGVILSIFPLFVLLYGPYFLFLPTYALPAAPAVIVGIILGNRMISFTWPGARVTVGVTLFVAGLAVAALPNWTRANPEDVFHADLLESVNTQLAGLSHRPAVVLFTYNPTGDVHQEPVYNPDVAWPDDAPIIRAHDRGPDNLRIFQYYAGIQPQRFFYRFDEKTRRLHPLGFASDLANKLPQ